MNRRNFVGTTVVWLFSVVAVLSGFVTGCNSNIWAQIQIWVPTGIAAFESVITLVAPLAAPGIDAIAETVKAAFAVLAGAISEYVNAPAVDKMTFLAKVQLAFKDVSDNLQAFLNAIQVSGTNPIIKVVLGLVSIILSTIASFMAQIGPTPAPVALKLGDEVVQVTPVQRTRKQFVTDFNNACITAGHPELVIH